ncbi:MAG: hypothetical protein QGH33_17095, partial [Pirellulaceae bacterium]|nr:hypothetical protein [Pirellulaceae bacterium]
MAQNAEIHDPSKLMTRVPATGIADRHQVPARLARQESRQARSPTGGTQMASQTTIRVICPNL